MTVSAIFPALLATDLVIEMSAKVTLFSSQQVRRMRWRIIFRPHPGPGFATLAELAGTMRRIADIIRRPNPEGCSSFGVSKTITCLPRL